MNKQIVICSLLLLCSLWLLLGFLLIIERYYTHYRHELTSNEKYLLNMLLKNGKESSVLKLYIMFRNLMKSKAYSLYLFMDSYPKNTIAQTNVNVFENILNILKTAFED